MSGIATWASTLAKPGEDPSAIPLAGLARRQRQLVARHSTRKRKPAPARLARRQAAALIVNHAEIEADAGEPDSRGQGVDPEIARLVRQSEEKRERQSLAEARIEMERYQPEENSNMSKTKSKSTRPSARDKQTIQTWEDTIRTTMINRALLKREAIHALATEQPDLHASYLQAFNLLARRDADLRSARGAVRREKGGR